MFPTPDPAADTGVIENDATRTAGMAREMSLSFLTRSSLGEDDTTGTLERLSGT
jgi:hypothetical protein